jgi:TolB-like protein/DNA-binding winged helix-turn-helix (wHTH) protein
MAVLVYLSQRCGEVVGKEELLREVWSGAHIEDVAVARSISELRRALGDDAANPRFIETIPKRGYRLIAPVQVAPSSARDAAAVDAAPGASSQRHRTRRPRLLIACSVFLLLGGVAALLHWRQRPAATVTARPITSVAVLPLRNLSGDPEQQFFADGMTEALTSDLAQIRAVRVVSGASRQRLAGSPLPEVASGLDVDGLVDGAISRSGDSLRLTIRLVERNGTVRWSRSYTAQMSDVFALQGDVAREVADEIRVTVEPRVAARLEHRRPVDSEAYVAYLQARQAWLSRTAEGFTLARRHFATALSEDPDFAPAHAGLAICRGLEANRLLVPAAEAYAEARREAERALALDPDLAEAHAALALVHGSYDGDLETSHRELRRAIELEPSNANYRMWMGQGLVMEADLVGAIRELEAALRLDPLFTVALNTLAELLRFAGHSERALRVKSARQALKSESAGDREHFEALVLATEGNDAAAIEAFARALQAGNEHTAATLLREDFARHGLATAVRNQEHRKLARLRSRQERGEYVSILELALTHVNAGDVDDSLDLLERARQEGAPDIREYLAHIAFDPYPILGPLRTDPRFDQLLAASGLPAMSSFRAAVERARETE